MVQFGKRATPLYSGLFGRSPIRGFDVHDKSRGGCSKTVIENTFSRYTFVEGCDIMYLSFLMTFAISPWRTIETFGGGTVPRLIELPLPLPESFGKLIAPTFARNASLKRRKAPLLDLLLGTIL
uniref:Uncharacterized protein n=1 Tax=Vespula pensylvanica TaxID=30213 RepID=A0A834NRX1_VESPE|nr:hypothetical protein H0235_011392 [Vespula pensylvanica]